MGPVRRAGSRHTQVRSRLLVAAGVLAAAACVQLAGSASAGGASSGGASMGSASIAAAGAAAAAPTPAPVVTESVPAKVPAPTHSAAHPPGDVAYPPAASAPPGASPLERGRRLYQQGCAGCHGQQGGGTQIGPTLRDIGAASADFQLTTGRMPLASEQTSPKRSDPAYGPADIDALVTYVASLGSGPPVPAVGPGDVQDGRSLYLTNCAACHSSTAVGAALPGGRYAPSLLPSTSQQIAEAVRIGPDLMPAYPSSLLSDQEVDSIATYVQSLSAHNAQGGEPLGAVGPVTEGVVGWILGLGLLVLVIRVIGSKAP